METMTLIISASAFVAGAVITSILFGVREKNKKNKAQDVLQSAQNEAERIKRNASNKAKEEYQNLQQKFKLEKRNKEIELGQLEKKLIQEDVRLKNLISDYQEKDKEFELKEQKIKELNIHHQNKMLELEGILQKELLQLQNIAQFSPEEARQWIIDQVREEARKEAAEMAMSIKNEMKEKANREAKDVLAKAIENMAFEYTIESTLSSIPLPNERIKGMIIGKGGSNIKSFEDITSVKLIIDETPETVILSAFDPIKRDIAGRTLKELIENKNINPKEIERVWRKKKADIERETRKAAIDTLKDLALRNVSEEMIEMLGRLKYRTSYGQNILQHSIEVAKLAGHMAGELGLDIELAKRAGLFHDLGKANSHDAEASHVAIGVEVATRAKEHPVVINAILSHHEEAAPISPISVLVNAADKISGSRPGARRDSLEQYTKRIESLETISASFKGVNKVYALSAGREVRVIVEPNEMSDAQANMLSSDIAKKIQESMEYPGTIKVTVLRQTVATAVTDNFVGNDKESFDIASAKREKQQRQG